MLTALGVLILIVLISGEEATGDAGWLWGTAGVAIMVVVGLAALVPVGLGIAYVLLRRRMATAETVATGTPDARAASLTAARGQRALDSLAGLLTRLDPSGSDPLGLRARMQADKVRISRTTLDALEDRWEQIALIWFVRPAQAGDFARSREFAALPVPHQDLVVLLDLRRELQLRGLASAFAEEGRIYQHGLRRIQEAAVRSGSKQLVDAITVGTLLIDGEGETDVGAPKVAADLLLAVLDEGETWERLLVP